MKTYSHTAIDSKRMMFCFIMVVMLSAILQVRLFLCQCGTDVCQALYSDHNCAKGKEQWEFTVGTFPTVKPAV